MTSQALNFASRLAIRKAADKWWQKVLKEIASVGVREGVREVIRRFAAEPKKKTLKRKLEELNVMLKKGLITPEEHAALRRRLIEEADAEDI